MFIIVSIRHLHRPGYRRRDAVGEPAAKRIIDNKQSKGGRDHSWQRRHPAKQQRKPPVKLVACHLLAAFHPQPQNLPDHERSDDNHRQHIHRNQHCQMAAVGLRRVELGQGVDCVDTNAKSRQYRQIADAVLGKAQQKAAARCRGSRIAHRPDQIPSSRIRLRSVLRLMPRISAAFT